VLLGVVADDGPGPARAPCPPDEEPREGCGPERRRQDGELQRGAAEGRLPAEDPQEQIDERRHLFLAAQRGERCDLPPRVPRGGGVT
jgi:hypothetical protein